MNNRCQDCNRFVSLEVEDGGADLRLDSGVVSGTVLLLLCCGECGTTMGEYGVEFECRTTDFEGV